MSSPERGLPAVPNLPEPPRVRLVQLPTPVHRLDRLSDDLGIDLWIKRDDLTGFALGGNKGRKLEFLMAEALAEGATAIVSMGATQSNFLRQLGAACSVFGLKCAAAVMRMPYYGAAGPPVRPDGRPYEGEADGGNVLIDEILGVDLRLFPDGDWNELARCSEAVALEYEREGHKVYRIPIGGSSPLGAYSFLLAALETTEQAGRFDVVVCPTSSGSTHAGLAYAFHGTGTRVIGISCDPDPDMELRADVADLCRDLDALTGLDRRVRLEDVDVRMDYFGPGYSIPSEAGNAAIRMMARREGVFLDPTYSGKVFSAVVDLARKGEIRGRTLFWHTGGTPLLFVADRESLVRG
ncbi:MAG: D-cysteine desulfhydrase family protein [Fimbriimonadaceae bacterium]